MKRVPKVDTPCGFESCDLCYRDAPTRQKPRVKKAPEVSFDMLMGRAVQVTETQTEYTADDEIITQYEYISADVFAAKVRNK